MPSIYNTAAIKRALSAPRLSTYETAVAPAVPADAKALELYAWHAQIAAAFLAPIHICEVVVRNAVSEALTNVYQDRWPWDGAFIHTLPNNAPGRYNPRLDIAHCTAVQPTTGKVIPELDFVFWEKMFTNRFDGRIWVRQLRAVMPNLNPSGSVYSLRNQINRDLYSIRKLRNRIAHHEPIFVRNLADDFNSITALIRGRCNDTADWMLAHQQVTALLPLRPQ